MPIIAKNKITLSLLPLMAVMLLLLSAVASAGGMIDTVTKKNRLTVGVALFEPWVMRDKEGELFGYDVDVARQLAKDLKVSVQFRVLTVDQLLDALLAEQIDIIISGMAITTERNLKANFTIPYSNSGIQLLANKAEVKSDLQEPMDFNDADIKLAVVKGTLAESTAREFFPKAHREAFDDESSALEAVKSGSATGMLAATPFPEQHLANSPDSFSMPLPRKLRRSSEAFVIRKQDHDSLNVLNNWILQRIEDGWLPDLLQPLNGVPDFNRVYMSSVL